MALKLFHRQTTPRLLCQSLTEKFDPDDQIEIDVMLYSVGGRTVYDMCKICNRPVLSGQDMVTQGVLTGERLLHRRCKETEHDNSRTTSESQEPSGG